jgi:hypothetical protein
MGSIIAGLDADLLSDHVPGEVLTPEEIVKLRRINNLLVHIIVRHWFLCIFSQDAPSNQLDMYKEFLVYRRFDKELADAAIAKLQCHLWPLSEEVVVFAFTSSQVSDEDKKAMAEALLKQPRGSSNLILYLKS